MKKIYSLLFFLASLTVANSQSGTLDTSFGNDGIVLTEITTDHSFGDATVVQADGKILVAGYAGAPSTYQMAVARYNTDGSLDTSFGNNGTLRFPVGTAKSYVLDMALQNDGKIVLGGYTYDNVSSDFAIVRLNTDGSFDNTFGSAGITILDDGGRELAEVISILEDGQILIAGDKDDNFAVARVNADGSLDTTFGVNGWAVTQFDTNQSWVKDIAVQNDDKIVLTGMLINGTSTFEIATARLNADGSADNSFGTNGKVRFNIGNGNDFSEGVAVQEDGKILIGGHKWIANLDQRHDFAMVRLNANGSFDTTYGNNGISTVQIVDGSNYSRDMLLQPDGKAILVGFTVFQGEYDMAMMRFGTDGILDTTFGTDGTVSTDVLGREDYGTAVTLQPDGKIVFAGYSYTAQGDASFVVARYNNTLLGTEDYQNVEFRLYPNPAREQLTIEMNDASSTYQLEIIDMLGKKVYNTEIQKMEQVDVSALATGTYLVKLNSNLQTTTVRFVKQ